MRRGDEYTQRVGIDGLVRTATDPSYRQFFEQYDVRVRFYGDYREVLTGTPYEYALNSMYEVMAETKDNKSFRLFFGVFADEFTETVSRLSVEHYLAHNAIPDRQTLVQKYYGEDLPPVSLFIGFDKFSVFDMPLLSTGEEDLYFSLSPSPYMTQQQLRSILYDHLYVRPAPEPDYTKLTKEERDWLREYYRKNRDYAFGVGKLKFNLWLPERGNEV
jgi:tuberculosinol/isotuberculosinol synthase